MTSKETSRSNSNPFSAKSPPYKSLIGLAIDHEDDEEDGTSELSLLMQVVKKQSSTTTVHAVLDKSGQVRYSISKQDRMQLDGLVGASPRIVDRMREDSVVRNYIPEMSQRGKKNPEKEAESVSISKEKEATNQRRRDKRRRQKERKKRQEKINEVAVQSPEQPLSTGEDHVLPVDSQLSSVKPSPLARVYLSSTNISLPPVKRSKVCLAPKLIDYKTLPAAEVTEFSELERDQVANSTPIESYRSAVSDWTRSIEEDETPTSLNSAVISIPSEDVLTKLQIEEHHHKGKSVKQDVATTISNPKSTQSTDKFSTPKVTNLSSPPSSPTSMVFRLLPDMVKFGPLRTPSPTCKSSRAKSASVTLAPLSNVSQVNSAPSPKSTSSCAEYRLALAIPKLQSNQEEEQSTKLSTPSTGSEDLGTPMAMTDELKPNEKTGQVAPSEKAETLQQSKPLWQKKPTLKKDEDATIKVSDIPEKFQKSIEETPTPVMVSPALFTSESTIRHPVCNASDTRGVYPEEFLSIRTVLEPTPRSGSKQSDGSLNSSVFSAPDKESAPVKSAISSDILVASAEQMVKVAGNAKPTEVTPKTNFVKETLPCTGEGTQPTSLSPKPKPIVNYSGGKSTISTLKSTANVSPDSDQTPEMRTPAIMKVSSSDGCPSDAKQVMVVSSDIKLTKPQARDRPFETALSSNGGFAAKSSKDLQRVCSARDLAQFSSDEINFLVNEIYKPDPILFEMSGAEPRKESADQQNKPVSSDPKVDELLNRIEHRSKQPMAMKDEPSNGQVGLRFKVPFEQNAHIIFYRNQEQVFRAMRRLQSSAGDNDGDEQVPKPIENEEQLIACQRSLMNEEKAFLDKVSQNNPAGLPQQAIAEFDGKLMMAAVLACLAATAFFLTDKLF